jgi:heme/copper-type cytochrome/quinol oxidase subunit 2
MTFGRLIALQLAGVLLPCVVGLVPRAWAEDPPTIQLTIKDHRFSPSEIHVPSGKPVILRITNADDTVEEFDSSALQVEKVIVAGHSATVRLHPLAPGRFAFMGEYHAETAKGVVIADP